MLTNAEIIRGYRETFPGCKKLDQAILREFAGHFPIDTDFDCSPSEDYLESCMNPNQNSES